MGRGTNEPVSAACNTPDDRAPRRVEATVENVFRLIFADGSARRAVSTACGWWDERLANLRMVAGASHYSSMDGEVCRLPSAD
jgi:hypothetical protein